MNNNKIEVLHFLPALDKSGISSMLRSFYGYMDHDLINFNFVHSGDKEDFHDELISSGSRIYELPPLSKVGIKQYSKNLKSIFDSIPNLKIVHIHKNYLSGIIAKVAKDKKIPVRIIHIRGTIIEGKIRYIKSILSSLMLRNGTDFFAVSPEAGHFYYGKHKFKVVNNAVDFGKFLNPDLEKLSMFRSKFGNHKFICQIGRLSHEKNHIFSVNLLKKVVSIDDNYRLIIVGDGELKSEIVKYAKELDIEKYIIFTGVIDEVAEVLALSKVNILPSFSEGLPNVIVQAQATNTISLVSDTITRTVDLSLGLVKFIPLSDLDTWVSEIFASNTSVDTEIIRDTINEKGFNVEVEALKLQKFYVEKFYAN